MSRLTPLINDLIDEGEYIITLPMLRERCLAYGYRVDELTIRRRLGPALMEVIKRRINEVTIHPVTVSYIAGYEEHDEKLKKLHTVRIPPKSRWEWEILAMACALLPIFGRPSYGLRLPRAGRNDVLFRLYKHVQMMNTIPKTFSQLRQITLAAEKKIIPKMEAFHHVVGAVMSLPPAINGMPEFKKFKDDIRKTISQDMERNFNKSRKGAWGL